MARKSRIIVIADDLSGAAELAGIAFGQGLSAEVQRRFDPNSEAHLVAVDTDSRSLSPADAGRRVHEVASKIAGSGPAWIFKKVDSVLRGNVRAEIEAVVEATGQARAVLIPANPTRGRIIVGGRYFVDGVPLDQTAFASEAEYPRRSAEIISLLGFKGGKPVHALGGDAGLPAHGIVVPDVRSEADLELHARAVDPTTLAAGAADFFKALLNERWDPRVGSADLPDPVIALPALLVCGSQNGWPIRRAECLAGNVAITTIESGERQVPFAAMLLGIGELKLGSSQAESLERLADMAGELIRSANVKTLLAEGGATASAIADRQGWLRFDVVATAGAGVGVLQPVADGGPLVLIKPGSYSWPGEVWESFCRCGELQHEK